MKANIETAIAIQYVKEVFGSCKILDEVDFVDLPEFIDFCKVVSNYKKMSRLLNES